MNFDKLKDHGWFVGSFEQAAYYSDLAEVCYRKEPKGPHAAHYHTRCTEILLIIKGRARVNEKIVGSGDIIIWQPGEINSIDYLEDTEVVCVKTPAGGKDKILI